MKKMLLIFTRNYWIHFLVWSIFIIYETIVVGLIFGVFGHPVTYISHYILVLCMFYFSANCILPWSLQKKTQAIWRIPLSYFLCISGYILSNFAIDSFLVANAFITHVQKISFDEEFILRVLYRCIYILGFSTAYYFLINFLRTRRIATESEKQRLLEIIKNERTAAALAAAENSFLKAQIKPHFFFNTLSYIHHQVSKHSSEAADSLVLLSEMMRYAMNSHDEKNFISILEEMNQVEKLLNLHQMRKNQLVNIDIFIDEAASHLQFIPLVLLTLAENMIKHGDLMDAQNSALFKITVDQNQMLQIISSNTIGKFVFYESNNSGLNNVINRLKYAYGDDIDIKYWMQDEVFTIKISVDIKVLNNAVALVLK